MSIAASIDSAKQEAFVGQVLANTSAAMVTTLAALGDRLGLFKTLAALGPATSTEYRGPRGPRRALHARMARRHDERRLHHIRRRDGTIRTAARARGRVGRRGRADVLRGHVRDAAQRLVSRRSHRRGVPRWRGRPAVGIRRALLGRDGALFGRMVRQPAGAAVARGNARRSAQAKPGRRRGRRRLRTRARADSAGAVVSDEPLRRVRRVRTEHRASNDARARGGRGRPGALRGSRCRRAIFPAAST